MPVVLADIDGTLVHSRRRCADVTGAVVAERYQGRDVGFISAAGWAMLARLQSEAVVVPATARTVRQYSRVEFPALPRVAVVAAGGLILIDGTPDPVWAAATEAMVAATSVTVADVVERMTALPATEEPRNGDDRFAYVRVAGDADIADFERWCAERGWRVVRQDGRVYALPGSLSKASAIPRLTEILGTAPTMVLGDGLMDVEMMRAVEHRISPTSGAIWTSGLRISTPAEGVGLAATEAVLEAAIALLATPEAASKAGPF